MTALRQVCLIALTTLCTLPATAENARVYDLDSLAWMATDIVEAELLAPDEGYSDPAKLRILAVEKGERKPGDLIEVYGVRTYRKSGRDFNRTKPLKVGDRLFLFVKPLPAENGFSDNGHSDALFPSDMRLIVENKAVPFVQFSNPGPLVALTVDRYSDRSPRLDFPTAEEFRKQIEIAIANAADYEKRFKEPPVPADISALIEFLRQRSELTEPHNRDKFAEEVCARLALLRDLDALEAALFLKVSSFEGHYSLERAFGFPEGRDFLLARIADEKQPVERRLRFARVLRSVGREYHVAFSNIGGGSATLEGIGSEDNAGYLTRIAEVTVGVKDESLRVALLDVLEQFSGSLPGCPDDDPIRVDLRSALPALIDLHQNSESPYIKFNVEQIVVLVSQSEYKKLGSTCGSLLSLIRPVDPKDYGEPTPGKLAYTYEIKLLDEEVPETAELILVHQVSGDEYRIKQDLRIRGRGINGGFRRAPLPTNLPSGTYRVFLRFSEGGKTISEGYGFETEL